MMSCTFGIGLQFSIFYVSQAQFYPVSIKYIAFGFGSIIEGISIAVPQLLMIDTGELGINPFLIVSLLAIGLFGLYFFVPETLNMKERDQIEEIESIKQKSD